MIDISPFEKLAKALNIPVEKILDINVRDLCDLAYDNGIELNFSLRPKEENCHFP